MEEDTPARRAGEADAAGTCGLGLPLVILLGLTVGIGAMTTDMYFPALPAMQHHFGVDAPAIQTTLSVFLAGLGAGQLLFGPLSDRFGRRVPLLAGLALYVAGSVLSVFSPDLATFLLGRFLQSLGAAAGVAIVRAIVTDLLAGRAAARMQNITMLIMCGATIIAPMIGGWLVNAAGWPSIFVVLSGLGALCLVTATAMIGESLPPERRSASLLGGQVSGWKALLGNSRYLLLTGSSGFAIAAIYALLMGSSFVYIDQFGWTADQYGLLYGSTTVAFIVFGLLNDRALRRWSPFVMLTVALPAQLAGCAALLLMSLGDLLSPLSLAVLLLFLLGNVAFIHGNLVAVVMEEARDVAGLGAGLLGAVQYGISALAPLAAKLAGGTPLHAMAVSTLAFTLLSLPGLIHVRLKRSTALAAASASSG